MKNNITKLVIQEALNMESLWGVREMISEGAINNITNYYLNKFK